MNGVVHFEIMAGAGGKTALRDFYAKTFDWEYQIPPGMDYGLLPRPEDGSGIGGAVDEDPAGAKVIVYIAVDDPHAYLAKAIANGATLVQDVTEVPGMVTFAQFRDPAGNVVGVVDVSGPPPA